jgi:hypothetical protein
MGKNLTNLKKTASGEKIFFFITADQGIRKDCALLSPPGHHLSDWTRVDKGC